MFILIIVIIFILFDKVFFFFVSSDLQVGDELIFVDNLENYHKKLPHSSALLDRLKFFSVRDPLSDSGGQNLREENIFRYLQII